MWLQTLRKGLLQLVCLIIVISSIPIKVSQAQARSDANIPSFTAAYQKDGHVKLEWATHMNDSDVLTKTGFESGEEVPSLTWGGTNPIGNQSITSGPNGGRVLQVTDTITGRTGNLVNFPDIDNDYSIANFRGRSVPGGVTVSLNYKACAIGGSQAVIQFYAATGWFRKGFPTKDYNGKDVKFGETVDFNYPPKEFSAYVDGGDVNFPDGYIVVVVSSRDQNYDYGVMRYTWKAAQKKFVSEIDGRPWVSPSPLGPVGSVKNEVFQKGDSILRYGEASYSFPVRNIPNDGEWVTISANAFIEDNQDYDFLNRGVLARLIWKTDGVTMIDDLKFGYASEAEVFRGEQSIYRGYLSDFEDTTAMDKTAPNEPGNVAINIGSDGKPVITWEAAVDNGTTYEYKIRGYPKNSPPTAFSEPIPVTVTAGIKGYAVAVDQNPGTVPTTVNVTGTSLTVEPQNGNFYVHIASVDNQGNVSNVVHVPYVDQTPPQLQVSADHTHWSRGPVTLSATAADYETGLKYIELPDGRQVASGTVQYVVQQNGSYTFKARDNAGNVAEWTIQVSNIDQEAPVITITPMGRTWGTGDIPVEIRYEDRLSGINPNSRKYALTTSALPPTQWSAAADVQHLIVSDEGEWYIHAQAVDQAGNQQQVVTRALQLQSMPQSSGNFRVTTAEEKAIHLSWDLPTGHVATSGYAYEVENQITGRNWKVSYPENTLIDRDVEPGKAYTYRIRSLNHVGSSAYSTVSGLTLPAMPEGLAMYPIDRVAERAQIVFEASRSAEKYQIEVKEAATQQLVQELTVTAATYQEIGQLQPGIQYTVSVTPENASGRGVAATIGFLSLPDAPGEFQVIQVKEKEAQLKWSTVTSATYYELQRDNKTVHGGAGTDYTDLELVAGTAYDYRVSAKNDTGFSDISKPIRVLTLPEKATVTAATYGTRSITLRWMAVKGADVYTVGINGQDIATVTGATYGKIMEHTIDGLQPGTEYRLHLYPLNKSGPGATTQLVAKTLPAAIPASQLGIDMIGETQARIFWAAVPGAAKYRVQINGKETEVSGTDLQVFGLTGGQKYSVRIEAGNESGYGPAADASFLTLPPQVRGLEGKEQNRELQLTWQPVPSAEFYLVEQEGQPVGKTIGPDWKADLEPGKSYRFTVRAVNTTGEGQRAPFVWRALPDRLDELQIRVRAITEHTAELGWEAVTGADRYRVYEGDKQLLETEEPIVILEGLESARTYPNLKVVPVNSTGESVGAIVPAFDTLPSGDFKVNVQAGKNELKYQFELASLHEIFVVVKDGREVYRGTDRVVVLDSLPAGTEVKVDVWTENAAGQRSKGQIIRNRTLPDSSSGNGGGTNSSWFGSSPKDHEKLENARIEEGGTDEREDHSNGEEKLSWNGFTDIDHLWNRAQVLALHEQGIIPSSVDGKFGPWESVTRAEFMDLIVRALQLESKEDPSILFKDVNPKAWYYRSLQIAHANGIVKGYTLGEFRPDEQISREQAAKMLGNSLGNSIRSKEGKELFFRDKDKISSWAKQEIEALTAKGIIKGYPDGTFRPKNQVNRAEGVAFIFNLLNLE